MGLDATVYINSGAFKSHPLRKYFAVDDETGQVYSISDSIDDWAMGPVECISRRLGNSASIDWLKIQMSKYLEKDSLILSLILYSGTHSGDTIHYKLVPAIRKELEAVRASLISGHMQLGENDIKDIKLFCNDLTDICDAAEKEKNPIVF